MKTPIYFMRYLIIFGISSIVIIVASIWRVISDVFGRIAKLFNPVR